MAVLFRAGCRIPVVNVWLIPDLVVLSAPTEMVGHPSCVIGEGLNLLGRRGRPEDGIEAAIGVVKTARRRRYHLWSACRRRGVKRVSVEQLDLDVHAVFDQRVNLVVDFLSDCIFSAFAFDPVPTRGIRAIFVLTDANETDTGVEDARPPPAVPGHVRVARKVGINPKAVVDLDGSSLYQVILECFAGPRTLRMRGRGKRQGKYEYRRYGDSIGDDSTSTVRVNHFHEPHG